MSYIIRSGNLTSAPTRTVTDSGRELTRARAAVSDRQRREDGTWDDGPTVFYDLTIPGVVGRRLADFHARAGNRRLVFAGTYSVREWTTRDGEQRLAHHVWVDHIGADLATNDLTLTTVNGDADGDEYAPEDLDLA